jgi:uncharacterized Zn finger protein (UPF0148 family)
VSPLQASCPACGAPVMFKTGSSIVVVCDFCHSVVARGDRRLEDLGKVAEVVETGSPLQVGLRGVYSGIAFELTGRAQLGHEAGGMWDEWYAAFSNGAWGWLAEAQGRFYFTFQQPAGQQALFPPFEYLQVGQAIAAIPGSLTLTVAEKGVARALGAQGEIPYRLVPGEQHLYADLSGPRGEFGTLDYSQPQPLIFLGREVTLAELGIASAPAPEREARRVEAHQLSCPNCGGPLALRAPDHTERVTCPNCGSLLDVNQGRLEFLKALQTARIAPIIPIGATGEFEGGPLTVIGFMQRSVQFDRRYYWEEYLLYNPQIGFRWLVRSDDHWSFVQSIPPGEIATIGKRAVFRGKQFRLFQDTAARVEHVAGEFYWKVTVGETVRAADYVRPPEMLSMEVSVGAPAEESQAQGAATKRQRRATRPAAQPTGEVNWSLGTYVKRRDVEKAFGISGLPRPSNVAPNQPFLHKKIYKYWALLLALTFIFGLVVMVTGARREVFRQTYSDLKPRSGPEDSEVRFSEPFELKGGQNIRITAEANVDNSWLSIDGDIIDQATGLGQAFSVPVEYYYGSEGGESWTEGSRSSDVHISALPAGTYTLAFEVHWEKWQQPASVTIRVDQGVPRVSHLILALVAISIIPIAVGIYQFNFEKRRWADSDHSPYSSS